MPLAADRGGIRGGGSEAVSERLGVEADAGSGRKIGKTMRARRSRHFLMNEYVEF
jgi:hypothetical protein